MSRCQDTNLFSKPGQYDNAAASPWRLFVVNWWPPYGGHFLIPRTASFPVWFSFHTVFLVKLKVRYYGTDLMCLVRRETQRHSSPSPRVTHRQLVSEPPKDLFDQENLPIA